jgi:hypothetical protein
MDRIISTADMANGRRMLLETLSAHFALLKANCPRQARTPAARRAQQYVTRTLRDSQRRRAA